jgi:glycosyltransferase involved in cell wall biosynthesis
MTRKGASLHVLYLEHSVGGVMGGSLTGLQHFLRGLDRRYIDPVVVLYEEKPLQTELAQSDIPVHVFRKRRRGRYHPLQKVEAYQRLRKRYGVRDLMRALRVLRLFLLETLPATFSLVRLMKKEKPDLIHLCNGFNANLDAIVAAWLTSIPCVCHVKGFEKYSWLNRLFAHTVEIGICMTAAVRQRCEQQRINAKRMTVIYDGLDVEGFRPTRESSAVRKELGIPLEVPLVGIVGNIQRWKGQAIVLEAVREARSFMPEIRCLIVGGVHRSGAEYAQELYRYVEEHRLQNNVIFTGFRDDVADLVAIMDVVIHASIYPEPFGRVILEAMGLGKPVIATDIGGVPEFVQHGVTGQLVPPRDPKALAEAMVELLRNPFRRDRLGSNGRLAVHERFTVQRHVQEVCNAYAHLGFRGPDLHSSVRERISQNHLPDKSL